MVSSMCSNSIKMYGFNKQTYKMGKMSKYPICSIVYETLDHEVFIFKIWS